MNPIARNDWDPLGRVPKRIKAEIRRFSYRRWTSSDDTTQDEKIVFLWLRNKRVCIFRDSFPSVKPLVHATLTAAKVNTIVYGSRHFLALDESGKMWSWGDNEHGQLGLGHRDRIRQPKHIPFEFAVKQIKAGQSFSMLLTVEERVHFWGCIVTQPSDDRHLHRRPKLMANLHFVRQIASGCEHALALDCRGRVYGWGSNGQGQLGGIDLTQVIYEPEQIVCDDRFRCKAIAAGEHFSLMLTIDGDVFQMGYFCRRDQQQSELHRRNIFQIDLDATIAAIQAHENLAILLTPSSQCYLLQRDMDAHLRLPLKILFNSIDDVLAYCRPFSSWKTQVYNAGKHCQIYGKRDAFQPYCVWSDMIDHLEVSDFAVIVSPSEKVFHVQQNILLQHSSIFAQLIQTRRASSSGNLTIWGYQYQTVLSFFRCIYLYEWPAMIDRELSFSPLVVIIELYNLAGDYCDEDLQSKCHDHIARRIDSTNCCSILEVARETQMHWLEKAAIKFLEDYVEKIKSGEVNDF